MRTAYAERLDNLYQNLEASCQDLFNFKKPDAGMHLIAWLNDLTLNDRQVCHSIWAEKVDCLPVSVYCDNKSFNPGVVLGFACAPAEEIKDALDKLQIAVRRL